MSHDPSDDFFVYPLTPDDIAPVVANIHAAMCRGSDIDKAVMDELADVPTSTLTKLRAWLLSRIEEIRKPWVAEVRT